MAIVEPWREGAPPACGVCRLQGSEAWAVADLYRAVADGRRPAADPAAVEALVQRARTLWKKRDGI
jgi:hypothetical protein